MWAITNFILCWIGTMAAFIAVGGYHAHVFEAPHPYGLDFYEHWGWFALLFIVVLILRLARMRAAYNEYRYSQWVKN